MSRCHGWQRATTFTWPSPTLPSALNGFISAKFGNSGWIQVIFDRYQSALECLSKRRTGILPLYNIYSISGNKSSAAIGAKQFYFYRFKNMSAWRLYLMPAQLYTDFKSTMVKLQLANARCQPTEDSPKIHCLAS